MSMTRKARPASPNPSGWPDEKAQLALKLARTELIAAKRQTYAILLWADENASGARWDTYWKRYKAVLPYYERLSRRDLAQHQRLERVYKMLRKQAGDTMAVASPVSFSPEGGL
nr:hypothetical protein [Brucella intermedia]